MRGQTSEWSEHHKLVTYLTTGGLLKALVCVEVSKEDCGYCSGWDEVNGSTITYEFEVYYPDEVHQRYRFGVRCCRLYLLPALPKEIILAAPRSIGAAGPWFQRAFQDELRVRDTTDEEIKRLLVQPDKKLNPGGSIRYIRYLEELKRRTDVEHSS